MLVLALDTASDALAIAFARYTEAEWHRLGGGQAAGGCACVPDGFENRLVASSSESAMRCANTRLLPRIEEMLEADGLSKMDIGAVVCGRGPGSFTGVRIGVATAKGIACGLDVPLYGVSTLEALAWDAWTADVRGLLGVVADALRKEVYPVRFLLDDAGVKRLEADAVDKPDRVAARWARDAAEQGSRLTLIGDGLRKHRAHFEDAFAAIDASDRIAFAPDEFGNVRGSGLLRAFENACRRHRQGSGDPGTLLPIYTRLSDAEENERIRLATTGEVKQGVIVDAEAQDASPTAAEELRSAAHIAGPAVSSADGFAGSSSADVPTSGVAEGMAHAGTLFRPLSRNDLEQVAGLEQEVFGAQAWTAGMFSDELAHDDRTWWVAVRDGRLCAYCGAQAACGTLDILDVGVAPSARRQGLATALLQRIFHDGIDLGCETVALEVREGNAPAIALYQSLGFEAVGRRVRYYEPLHGKGPREDALIMSADMRLAERRASEAEQGSRVEGDWVAGMELERRARVTAAAQERASRPLILAIESSCDETAAAVIDGTGAQVADAVASQIDFHARFGGVVPEIASRKHTEAIVGVVDETMARAGRALAADEDASPLRFSQLDAIAVTQGPGLIGALVVGVAFAKGLSWAADVPLIGVNHLEGHIYANRIANPDIEPPFIVSLLSGGHTMLVHVKDWGEYEVLGQTLDDAVGEAFDKVSKALGLGYPGGPIISRYAAEGDPAAIDFPRAMMHSGDYTFSLSGLKTAVITYLRQEAAAGRSVDVADVAASFQQAVIDVQVAKALTACESCGCTEFCIGGGVAANKALREACVSAMEREGIHVTLPPLSACTDNASMIAAVALDTYRTGANAPHRADGLGGFLALSADATARFPL